MKTVFPYEGRIDFDSYLEAYMKRDDAIRAVPSDEELKELARKGIIREQLVLVPVNEGECAENGDTAVLKTESVLPRYNKPKVTVTLGRGLYNRELENALIGKRVMDTVTLSVQNEQVTATLLQLKRKQEPKPTDEMVEALQVKDFEGNLIRTVAQYEEYIHTQKTMEVLSNINYYVMENILNDYPMQDYDKDDIRILGELEKEAFIRIFREQDGIDLNQEVPKSWEEDMNIHSVDEFIAIRHDWYQMKIQQCHIYLNILGLKPEGKYDPLDHYEVLSELQNLMFEKIRKELERRNGK